MSIVTFSCNYVQLCALFQNVNSIPILSNVKKLTISPKGFMTRCWRRAGGQTLETPSWPSAAPHDESLLRGTQRWPIFRWSSNKFGGWHSEGFKVRKVWSRIAKLQRNLKVYSFRRKHSGRTRGSNFTQGHKSWSLVDDIYPGPILPATSASIPEHTQQCHKPMVFRPKMACLSAP